MTTPLKFKNLCLEAIHLAEVGHEAGAVLCLDQARGMLVPAPVRPAFCGRPEDDPSRPKADREDWRNARGA